MTIPSPAFYLSQANTEFAANGYATNILSKAGIASPVLLSTLAGMSAVPPMTVMNLTDVTLVRKAGDLHLTLYLSGGNIYRRVNNNGSISDVQISTGVGKAKFVHSASELAGGGGVTSGVMFTVDATQQGIWVDIGGEAYEAWRTGTVYLYDMGGVQKGTFGFSLTVTD